MAETLSDIDQMSLSVNRGMHRAVLRQLSVLGSYDLRHVSEPMRQRLIDLAMLEPPLVDVDADRVSLTEAGRKVAESR